MTVRTLSARDARRLAVAAQGLDGSAGLNGSAGFDDCAAVLRYLGAIQLDAIQRVDKAHRLTCLARRPVHIGRTTVDSAFWGTGPARAFEGPAHAVCLLPADDWPLWEFRRKRIHEAPWRPAPAVAERVLDTVRDSGPLTLRQIEGEDKSSGWDWSATKQATEFLVWTGQLICCERRGSHRVYDLPERRLPGTVLGADPGHDESLRQLVARAARALGVATLSDLAEYFRLPRPDVVRGIELADLVPVDVVGWDEPAWAWPAALDGPGDGARPTLICPFDNLVWDRDRTRRLFDRTIVLEAYKPAGKRQYGYYVLPLLVGDELVGRVDLARRGTTLEVLAAHPEHPAFHEHIDAALRRLAAQINCDQHVYATAPSI